LDTGRKAIFVRLGRELSAKPQVIDTQNFGMWAQLKKEQKPDVLYRADANVPETPPARQTGIGPLAPTWAGV
jgi:hypothetical protein